MSAATTTTTCNPSGVLKVSHRSWPLVVVAKTCPMNSLSLLEHIYPQSLSSSSPTTVCLRSTCPSIFRYCCCCYCSGVRQTNSTPFVAYSTQASHLCLPGTPEQQQQQQQQCLTNFHLALSRLLPLLLLMDRLELRHRMLVATAAKV